MLGVASTKNVYSITKGGMSFKSYTLKSKDILVDYYLLLR